MITDKELTRLVQARLDEICEFIRPYYDGPNFEQLSLLEITEVLLETAKDFKNEALEHVETLENCSDQDEYEWIEHVAKCKHVLCDRCTEAAAFMLDLHKAVANR